MLTMCARSQCLFTEDDMVGLLKSVLKNSYLYSLNKHCITHIFKYTQTT